MKIVLYEPYEVRERKLPLNYDEIAGREYIVRESYSYGATYLCFLQNAYVSSYGVVFKNWRVLNESLSSYNANVNYYFSFFKKILQGKVKKVNGPCIIANNVFYTNYYHFVAEAVPRLFSVRDYASTTQLLIPDELPTFAREFICLLGFKNLIPINKAEIVFAQELLLPMHTAYDVQQNPALIRSISDWFRDQAITFSKGKTSFRNIYISRRKAAYRHLLNEPEVMALLEEFGFETVFMEDYSIKEKISLMAEVRNVVAIHGAGLVNMIFMPPGGLIVDLIHEEHFDESMYNLCSAMDHESIFLQGKAARLDERGASFDSFTIDTALLRKYLETYTKQ